jgi:hypothetical protein
MRHRTIALALAALVLGTAGQASAQGRNRDTGWWPWQGGGYENAQQGRGKKAEKAAQAQQRERERVLGRIEDRDDDDREGRGREARRGNGPPFCRNGQGHPTKGMEWCREKGWTQQSGWGNIIYRNPLPSDRQPRARDILDSVILGRLTDYSRQLGARGPIESRSFWVGDASVLQLRAGGVPLAEFTDWNRDGRVDLVLVPGR